MDHRIVSLLISRLESMEKERPLYCVCQILHLLTSINFSLSVYSLVYVLTSVEVETLYVSNYHCVVNDMISLLI